MTNKGARAILRNMSLWNSLNVDEYNALKMAIKALEQEPKTEQFAKWVAKEIFDENWEYNKEVFAELACRKLAKLGIVIRMGDEWELIEPQESEVSNG